MAVSRSVLHAKELCCLGQIGCDWVVAGDLTSMRVVATKRPLHVEASRDHGSIDIHGEAPELKTLHGVGEHVGVQRLQSGSDRAGASGQPPTQRSISGKNPKTTESLDQGITDQIADVTQAAGSHHEHREQNADDPDRREVPSGIGGPKVLPKSRGEVDPMEILPEELDPGVGGEPFAGEANPEIGLDRGRQLAFSMSHRWCLSGSRRGWLCFFFLTTRKLGGQGKRRTPLVGGRLFLCAAMTN